MRIKGRKISLSQCCCLILYYAVARHLPQSITPILGKPSKLFRRFLCGRIFHYCGENVNIEKGVVFGDGLKIEIGDNSGIGVNAVVPNNIIIGKNVMMGPSCHILNVSHNFERTDIPMIEQGYQNADGRRTIIGDDVWIGRQVTMTPYRHVSDGTIIGACCLLCKDFPAYSIVGGNPSRLLRSRKENEKI